MCSYYKLSPKEKSCSIYGGNGWRSSESRRQYVGSVGDRPQNGLLWQTAKEHCKSWFTLDRAWRLGDKQRQKLPDEPQLSNLLTNYFIISIPLTATNALHKIHLVGRSPILKETYGPFALGSILSKHALISRLYKSWDTFSPSQQDSQRRHTAEKTFNHILKRQKDSLAPCKSSYWVFTSWSSASSGLLCPVHAISPVKHNDSAALYAVCFHDLSIALIDQGIRWEGEHDGSTFFSQKNICTLHFLVFWIRSLTLLGGLCSITNPNTRLLVPFNFI